jgi:hypothetical protein
MKHKMILMLSFIFVVAFPIGVLAASNGEAPVPNAIWGAIGTVGIGLLLFILRLVGIRIKFLAQPPKVEVSDAVELLLTSIGVPEVWADWAGDIVAGAFNLEIESVRKTAVASPTELSSSIKSTVVNQFKGLNSLKAAVLLPLVDPKLLSSPSKRGAVAMKLVENAEVQKAILTRANGSVS